MPEFCQVCEKRRPRRSCPGVRGEICAPCCGEQREITIDCPLDCEYLAESRLREKIIQQPQSEEMAHSDVRITEQFIRDHQDLLLFTSFSLLDAALSTEGAVDGDVREALEAMIRTLRTLNSGLIYETKPANPYAAAIQERLQMSIDDLRKREAEQTGLLTTVRDNDVLGVLVFLARVAAQHDNHRRRGRAFVDFLRSVESPGARPAS